MSANTKSLNLMQITFHAEPNADKTTNEDSKPKQITEQRKGEEQISQNEGNINGAGKNYRCQESLQVTTGSTVQTFFYCDVKGTKESRNSYTKELFSFNFIRLY